MKRLQKTAVAIALAGLLAAPARAEEGTLQADYFIGHWGMGAAEECASRDTMSFYDSGAWAVTNGRGNPVEAIGTWRIEGQGLTIRFSELEAVRAKALTAAVAERQAESFVMLADALRGGRETLYRCQP